MSINDTIQQWFFKRIKSQKSPIVLDRRTIYVLPTRYGLFFAVVLFILLLGSVNYSNSMGFLLTFLLMGIALIAMLHTYRNLSHLQISVGKSHAVFNGELAEFQLLLSTRDNHPAYAIQINTHRHSEGAAINDVSIFNESEQQQSFQLRIQTTKRGILALGKVRLWTEFPLGLFHVWSWLEPQASLVVYPSPSGKHSTPPTADFNAGDTKKNGLGNDDYAGMRNYHQGDPLSQIAWKVLARSDITMTKQFTGLSDNEVWLDWFVLEKMDIEERLSQLCQWVIDMELSRRHYGLRLPKKIIEPNHGEAHKQQCLRALALFN